MLKSIINKDWDKTISAASISILLLMLVSLLVFTVTSYRHRFHSDAATAAMIALEQLRTGSLFVQGWYYSQDFWPMFVFNGVVVLQPILNNAFLSTQIPVLLQTMGVFILTICLLKNISDDSLIYIVASFLFSGVSFFWSEWFFGQGQYGNVLLWLLSGVILIMNTLKSSRTRQTVFFLSALFCINFYIHTTSVRYVPMFSAVAMASLLMMSLLKVGSGGKRRMALLGVVLLTSTLLGMAGFLWLKSSYLFLPGIAASQFVAYGDAIGQNIPALLSGLFSLMIDPATGVHFASIKGAFFAYRLCLGLIIIALPVCAVVYYVKNQIKTGLPEKTFLVLFTMTLLAISLFSLVFTSITVNEIAAARYIMISVYFCLILIPLLFEKHRPGPRGKVLVLLALVPLLAYNAYSMNRQMFDTKSSREKLADFLVQEGLTTGYATYWQANVLTVMSNYRLKVYHVMDTEMKPLLCMSTANFYRPTKDPYNFLLLTQAECSTFNLAEVTRKMGEPVKVLDYPGYKIFVYDKPFAGSLPDWKSSIHIP